jgi:hypothetical protein
MDGALDMMRLTDGFQYLVDLHPILRTVFVEYSDAILQVVLKKLPIEISRHTCPIDQDLEQYAKALANEDINTDSSFRLGNTFTRVFLLTKGGKDSLMIRMSHAQYDGVSLPQLLHQLHMRYRGDQVSATAPFQNYLHHVSLSRSENINYWQKRLQGSCLTDISSPADPTSSTTQFFTKAVDVSGRPSDMTLATLLTAGWARVLANFHSTRDVTFAGIVTGRNVEVGDIENIMGPCYQYMPVRVQFQAGWTCQDLLHHVRDQYLEGSSHATLGFQDMRKNCTSWEPTRTFYTSFVNHLDTGYMDTMAFGYGQCRVDYAQPHPEPSTPPRVVSFVEGGKTLVGIEADGERQAFWEARLAELAHAVELFASNPLSLAL